MNVLTKFFLEIQVRRLKRISKRYGDKDGAGFLKPGGEDACRRIGSTVNLFGGHESMVYVCDRIREEIGYGAYREVEVTWNRIGRWRG